MKFRASVKVITPCEILREINDLVQTDKPEHIAIRNKLAKIQWMLKLMSKFIYKRDKRWAARTFIEKNTDELADWDRRLAKGYKVGKYTEK